MRRRAPKFTEGELQLARAVYETGISAWKKATRGQAHTTFEQLSPAQLSGWVAIGREIAELGVALAACRSIRFAITNATRHGGKFSLNDLLAADRLANEALQLNSGKKGAAK